MIGMAIREMGLAASKLIACFVRDESGTAAIEYGVLGMLASVAAFAAMSMAGSKVHNLFNAINDVVTGAVNGL